MLYRHMYNSKFNSIKLDYVIINCLGINNNTFDFSLRKHKKNINRSYLPQSLADKTYVFCKDRPTRVFFFHKFNHLRMASDLICA